MEKLIEEFKGSAWNSRWGRIGLSISIPAAVIGHYLGTLEGLLLAAVLGIPAWLVALFLDWRRPIER